MKTENIIVEKSFRFSLDIIELYKKMIEQKEFVLSRQLLRSATSIGANVEEAMAAQSRRDFVNKMAIASKEARESRYWLRLLQEGKMIEEDLENYIDSSNNIINILTSIVKTTQSSLDQK